MNINQNRKSPRPNSIDSILAAPSFFPLDSLDAELSIDNISSNSWGNYSFAPQANSTSGAPTVTVQRPSIGTENTYFGGGRNNNGGSYNKDNGSKSENSRPNTSNSNSCHSDSHNTPVNEFNQLNLDYQTDPLSIAGPVCLMNGDIVDYVDHLFPISPAGSSDVNSAPNSPVSDFVKTEYAVNPVIYNQTYSNSIPDSPAYLQASPQLDSSPVSSSSPLTQANELYQQQQQQQQDWLAYQSTIDIPAFINIPTSYDTNTPQDELLQQQQELRMQTQQHQEPAPKRVSHNAVEKKYRNNINDRITELKEAVPALRHARIKKVKNDHDNDDDSSDEPVFMDGVAVATKLNKATILQKATEYIHHLQQSNQEWRQDIEGLLTTIVTQLPDGQDIANQYRRHVMQRELMQRRQQACREKMKRYKKSALHHHRQHHHHHHHPMKGEDRNLDQRQLCSFIQPQEQQQQQQHNRQ